MLSFEILPKKNIDIDAWRFVKDQVMGGKSDGSMALKESTNENLSDTDINEVEKADTFMTANTGVVTPDTKGMGPLGIFRYLPAELRRAGNEVFNQAKNRLPTGRVFGGKVFPPYF